MATNANSIRHIAGLLNSIDWMDQESALQVLPLADAALDALTVVIYQAGTGRATRRHFLNARKELQRAIGSVEKLEMLYSTL